MSCSNLLIRNGFTNCVRQMSPLAIATRHGHTMRGRPPGEARSLEQRLQEENVEDPEVAARVNIGFPKLKSSRSEQVTKRMQHFKDLRANKELEKQARNNTLLIDLDKVEADYNKTNGPFHLRTIAEHYGIFKHLFGSAYFVPRVPLDIQYEVDKERFAKVYCGNIIKPAEAAKAPMVNFEGAIDPITEQKAKGVSYWTLVATNPDGHFTKDGGAEYVHWFVGNIPNGDFTEAEVIADYLPPFPPKGIGYQRFIFVLYKQNKKLDFSDFKIDAKDRTKLDKRTFSTLDFYSKYQEDITPAGLAFYQTDWDATITDVYHKVLNMKEPIYEYDFPKPYLADQKWFPLKKAFNLYLDRHRDIKQINKEYLERKLAKTHPFDGPEPPLRYPNAHPIRNVPSWLKTEIENRRLGKGRINDYK